MLIHSNKQKRKKQKTNKSSKFIKEKDESQAIRTAPISDQLLQKYLFEIKSLGCPEGKLIFKEPPKPILFRN